MAGLRASKRFVVATRRAVESCLLLALAIFPTGARCETIETEHLFGFTIGSDVGDVGERELEGSATGRFAKQNGTYAATTSTMSVEFVPMANLRTEFTGAVVSYDIAGVSGLLDQRYVAFGGFSADIRYRLLDRATAPFGFAIGAEPHWGRADEITGEPANQYGVDFVAAADWEIVPDRVVAAFNLLYQPDTMRSKLTGTWSQESTAGVAFGRDGASPFRDLCRWRSALPAQIRWRRARQFCRAGVFHWTDDLFQALRESLAGGGVECASGGPGDDISRLA